MKMVQVHPVIQDYKKCLYVTLVVGNNGERFVVKTNPENGNINPNGRIKTILYKRLKDNIVAQEQQRWVEQANPQFAYIDMHEPIIETLVNHLS
jgi:hypothetical protein